MIYPSLTFCFTVAVFLAVIVTLALRPAATHRIITVVVIVSAILGLAFYGFGYGASAETPQEAFIAACRAIFSTTFMFAGRENFSELFKTAVWFSSNAYLQILFWLVHLCAIYATASTVLSSIGIGLVRMLRSLILPFCRVCILFGSDDALVSAAGELASSGCRPLIVSDSGSEAVRRAADAAGGLTWREERIKEDGQWLSRLGIRPHGRKLEILCTQGDDGATTEFLLRLIAALKAKGIDPEQIHICVVCQSEANFDFLPRTVLQSGKHLAADIYSTSYLAASILIAEAPPYKTLRFDPLGNADGDFCAMVIGFGSLGQNVLRLLVRNGQFLSSSFSAVVIDRDLDGCTGAFKSSYGEMIDAYNISFTQTDARSETFVKLLETLSGRLKYIVVCTGDALTDRKIANQLCTYRMCHAEHFSPRLCIAICSSEQICLCGSKTLPSVRDGSESERGRQTDQCFPVIRTDELLEGRTDALARAVNSIYLKDTAMQRCGDDMAAREAFCRSGWYAMSNISRMSCRAAASAIPAMLAAAGVKEGSSESLERCRRRAETEPEFLDALSRMEHLRWNAFQHSIGVARMPKEEFERRIGAAMDKANSALATLSALEKDEEGKKQADKVYTAFRSAYSSVRKDIPTFGVGGVHACLTAWDELPMLWEEYEPLETLAGEIECAYAKLIMDGGASEAEKPPAATNFQRLDTNNVVGILELLAENEAR